MQSEISRLAAYHAGSSGCDITPRFGRVETVKLSVIFRTVLYTNCFSVIGVEDRSTMANLKFLTILIRELQH